jgi:hypothetical protein
MSEEIVEKMKLVEKEKSELFAMHLRRQSELEQSGRSEIERLKESHRFDWFRDITLTAMTCVLYCTTFVDRYAFVSVSRLQFSHLFCFTIFIELKSKTLDKFVRSICNA